MNDQCSYYYRKLPDKPVAMHFNTSGHTFDNATVMVIEQMCLADSANRKKRKATGSIHYGQWPRTDRI